MRARGLLIVTAIVSAILGAVVAYLVLTVPNDIQAAALMRRAKGQIEAGKTDQARTSLARIIQQYPRTDAAAAATLALIRLDADDGARTEHELATLRESLSMTIARLAAAASVRGYCWTMRASSSRARSARPAAMSLRALLSSAPAWMSFGTVRTR